MIGTEIKGPISGEGTETKENRRMQWRRRQPEPDYYQTSSWVLGKQKFLFIKRNPFISKQIGLNGIMKIPSLKLIPYVFGLLEIRE